MLVISIGSDSTVRTVYTVARDWREKTNVCSNSFFLFATFKCVSKNEKEIMGCTSSKKKKNVVFEFRIRLLGVSNSLQTNCVTGILLSQKFCVIGRESIIYLYEGIHKIK